MLAIDTNLIVRYLTADDRRQAAKARKLIDSQAIFVSLTVLLECEWVLRSVYGYATDALAGSLAAFAGLPTVTIQDAPIVARALRWMRAGMDFADALHLGQSAECDAFVTFDTRFAKLAAGLDVPKVRVL